MTELTTGRKAPSFELPRDGGGTLKLSDFGGKAVVLYFYPQDDTETCTAEAIEFSKARHDFEKAGAVIVGVSPDSVESHQKFHKKYGLDVRLAADADKEVAGAYEVWVEKSTYGAVARLGCPGGPDR